MPRTFISKDYSDFPLFQSLLAVPPTIAYSSGTQLLPNNTPVMRFTYLDTDTVPHVPLRIQFEDLYPGQLPEETDNYVMEVELFEAVRTFAAGTFSIAAPPTCDALDEAMPPRPYPNPSLQARDRSPPEGEPRERPLCTWLVKSWAASNCQ